MTSEQEKQLGCSKAEITIVQGCLDTPEVQSLLREHLASMSEISPPESCHAMDSSELQDDSVTFWSAWQGKRLAGCGALKELDSEHGEIKSMRTSSAFLRKGVAARILEIIISTARARQYDRLSLETGSMDEFMPARRLYLRYGFDYCPPFGSYVPDPNSTFMTLALR